MIWKLKHCYDMEDLCGSREMTKPLRTLDDMIGVLSAMSSDPLSSDISNNEGSSSVVDDAKIGNVVIVIDNDESDLLDSQSNEENFPSPAQLNFDAPDCATTRTPKSRQNLP